MSLEAIEQRPHGRLCRAVVVLAGILAGQAILYGPSLIGWKVLLPLDVLARKNAYLPMTAEVEKIVPHDMHSSDLIYSEEQPRRFTLSEFRAGRMPWWCPDYFAGTPCHRWTLSLLSLPGYFVESPVVLAWIQVLVALVAGCGAFVFLREVSGVSFWPATIAGWCYPLTAFFIVWQGFRIPLAVCWLPWILFAVDRSVRQPWGWGGPLLALLTAVLLHSGGWDVAGQVLLTSGIFAVWCLFDASGASWFSSRAGKSVCALLLAWTLGILASMWLLLPLMDYSRTGLRMARRAQGEEERPPFGIRALPQVVLPEMYGTTLQDSYRFVEDNVPESSAAAYAGILATLVLAPLSWCSRKHRSLNVLWAVVIFVSLSWCLDVPGMVHLLRSRSLNMMSHNRFVCVTSFAILAMAAVGLDLLCRNEVTPRNWFALPIVVLTVLLCWCVYRLAVPPVELVDWLSSPVPGGPTARYRPPCPPEGPYSAPQGGSTIEQAPAMANTSTALETFRRSYAVAAAFSAIGLCTWVFLWLGRGHPWLAWLVPGLGGALIVELLRFGYGYNVQCDPSLYFPRIPVLEEIRLAEPGRVIGSDCLAANLASIVGLRDVRGYDAVDPKRIVELVCLAAHPDSPRPSYALTQVIAPWYRIDRAKHIEVSPILDMLNVRYVIFRGSPPPTIAADYVGFDYWIATNRRALPRAFVPKRVEVVTNDEIRLRWLLAPDFDARQVAYVESSLSLPPACYGTASIASETPAQLDVSYDMQTSGVVVLSDQWYPGWHATLNGSEVPICRTNHALRGVVVPAGKGTIHFRYEPNGLRTGLILAGAAGAIWIIWLGAQITAHAKK